MAIVYLPHSTLASGQVVFELKVNNANWSVLAVRCTNNSDQEVYAEVFASGESIWTQVFPANQVTEQPVAGVQLDWQPDYFNTDTQEWEAGGIEMGIYVVSVRWPA